MLAADRRLGYGDGRLVKVGESLSTADLTEPTICRYGMHASTKILDALFYLKGPILCRVTVSNEICKAERPYRSSLPGYKFCGRERLVLWMKQIPKDVLLKACQQFSKTTIDRSLVADRNIRLVKRLGGSYCLLKRRSLDHVPFKHLNALLNRLAGYASKAENRQVESFLKGWALYNGAIE